MMTLAPCVEMEAFSWPNQKLMYEHLNYEPKSWQHSFPRCREDTMCHLSMHYNQPFPVCCFVYKLKIFSLLLVALL